MRQAVVCIRLDGVVLAVLLIRNGAVRVVFGGQRRLRRVRPLDLGQLVVRVVNIRGQVVVGVRDRIQVLVRVVVPGRGVVLGVGQPGALPKRVVGIGRGRVGTGNELVELDPGVVGRVAVEP